LLVEIEGAAVAGSDDETETEAKFEPEPAPTPQLAVLPQSASSAARRTPPQIETTVSSPQAQENRAVYERLSRPPKRLLPRERASPRCPPAERASPGFGLRQAALARAGRARLAARGTKMRGDAKDEAR
jgi:hypothetical protein